ncbi:MAG: hypothetical protein AUREO_046770 [Aureobasidium pullulans]|nr:MAG: Uncharacterized protein AUREO_048960 [Aureobasidium pullulans]OBW65256.1 MAG: hypothetical protein AUREO_046770 [Aureobasidium pullulans]
MAWFRLSRRKRKPKTTSPQIPTYDIIGLRAQILANLRVCQPRLRGFTIGTAFNRTAQVWHGIISWDVDGSEVCKTPEFATMGLALEFLVKITGIMVMKKVEEGEARAEARALAVIVGGSSAGV